MSTREIRNMFHHLSRGKSPHWCMQRRRRPLVAPVKWHASTFNIPVKHAA